MLRQALALTVLLSAVPALAQTVGQHDHAVHMGASVMPFDLDRSTHVFARTITGGTQDVVSKDSDPAQIAMIRSHLRGEADAFALGNYAHPAAIHGSAMPGLAELQAGAARMQVVFEQLPAGARLRFVTRDPALVDALHRWFVAQVHDHGADASMKR